MKCKHCNGTGNITRQNGTELFGLTEVMTCDLCNGTGEVEMNNEQWFCNLPTEEKVSALVDMAHQIKARMKGEIGSQNKFENGGYFREWLKEVHK